MSRNIRLILMFCLGAFIAEEGFARPNEIIRIDFKGNTHIRSSDLKNRAPFTIPNPFYFWKEGVLFEERYLLSFAEKIKREYRQEGYYDATATISAVTDTSGVVIKVHIDEGEPLYVHELHLKGLDPPLVKTTLPLQKDALFKHADYLATEVEIMRLVHEQAYPWATIKRSAVVDTDKKRAVVTYEISPGKKAVWSKIEINGLQKYRKKTILPYVPDLEGTPYSDKSIRLLTTSLQKSHLIRSVKIDTHKVDPTKVSAHITLFEKPPRGIYLSAGYDTEEGARARARWHHLNLFGNGEYFNVSVTESQTGFYYGASLEKKYLSNSFDGKIQAKSRKREEETFDLHEERFEIETTYNHSTQLAFSLGYEYMLFDQRKMESSVETFLLHRNGSVLKEGDVGGAYLKVEYHPFIDRDRYDLRPWSYRTLFKVSSLGTNKISTDYVKADLEQGFYYMPWDKGKIVLNVNISFLTPLKDEASIPVYHRLYAGGDNGVRGYERWHLGPLVDGKPVGGLSRLESALEYRHRIRKDWDILAFIDGGDLHLEEYTFSELSLSTGTGFAYNTDQADFLFSIAFPLDPPPDDREWNVHFSINKDF